MPRPARYPILVAVLAIFCAAGPVLMAADGAVASRPSATVSYILIGFAGGFERHDSPRHGPVKLAQRIRQSLPTGDVIEVFENRHRRAAYKTILRLLDSNHDGVLSAQEKHASAVATRSVRERLTAANVGGRVDRDKRLAQTRVAEE